MSFATRIGAARIAVVFLMVLLGIGSLAGCSTNDANGSQSDTQLGQLTDVPLPAGYSLNHSDTFILGEGDHWSGRLAYSINSSADDMFNFIRQQMPAMGWHEVSVYRAPVSVLTYTRGNRVATVRISSGTFYGSNVEMVVAPETGNAAFGGQQGALQPPPPPGPNRAVTVQPLK